MIIQCSAISTTQHAWQCVCAGSHDCHPAAATTSRGLHTSCRPANSEQHNRRYNY